MQATPPKIKYIQDISTNAYSCSYDNTFLLFKSSQNIFHIIYSTLNRSIISYNISNPNNFQILTEIKKAHDDYIDNFRYSFDIKNKRDLILSLSSGDNNIKIWNLKNFECIFNFKNIYKIGTVLSACFLIDEKFEYNYIIACNFFMYNIKLIDLSKNKEKNIEIENNINTNLFIDRYYDTEQNKYYIITGNNWNVNSYDFEKRILYHTYETIQSTNHKTAHIFKDSKNIVKIFFPCKEGYLLIFNFHTGEMINKIFCGNDNDNLIGFCFWNENFIFTGGKNKILKLVDLNKGEIIKEFKEHKQLICSMKTLEHKSLGKILITHGLDNKIKLWTI